MSGRSSISYRALSRCLVSLASAGSVCCAKPNHGFSGCQQASVTFSWCLSRTRKRASRPVAPRVRFSLPGAWTPSKHRNRYGPLFPMPVERWTIIDHIIGWLFFRHPGGGQLPRRDTRRGSRRYRHARQFSRRTSGFARKLRRHRAWPIDAGARNRRSDARLIARTTPAFASAGTSPKKPAALGGRSGSIRKHELSGRLPRAIRHSRPGRAVP